MNIYLGGVNESTNNKSIATPAGVTRNVISIKRTYGSNVPKTETSLPINDITESIIIKAKGNATMKLT
jgi:hypothetical protein